MPRLNAHIGLLFTELPLLDRFAAAARVGFRGVESRYTYDDRPEEIAAKLRAHDLTQVSFTLHPPALAPGQSALSALPGYEREFEAYVIRSLEFAKVVNCSSIHLGAGNVIPGREAQQLDVMVGNLKRASDLAAPYGITFNFEPICVHSQPHYLLKTMDRTIEVLDRIDRPNIALLLDLYHLQVIHGNLAGHMRSLFGRYNHVQIAGAPGRHEPDDGEINYGFLLEEFDRLGYDGWVGAEYVPANGTLAGLGWARRWGIDPEA